MIVVSWPGGCRRHIALNPLALTFFFPPNFTSDASEGRCARDLSDRRVEARHCRSNSRGRLSKFPTEERWRCCMDHPPPFFFFFCLTFFVFRSFFLFFTSRVVSLRRAPFFKCGLNNPEMIPLLFLRQLEQQCAFILKWRQTNNYDETCRDVHKLMKLILFN